MFIFANKNTQNEPWNKGKMTGQKPPLLPKHVWALTSDTQALFRGKGTPYLSSTRERRFFILPIRSCTRKSRLGNLP